ATCWPLKPSSPSSSASAPSSPGVQLTNKCTAAADHGSFSKENAKRMVASLLLLALAAGPKGPIAIAISENSPQTFTKALSAELAALGWKVAETGTSSVRGWAHDGIGSLRVVDTVTGDVMLRHGGTNVKAIAKDMDEALAAWALKGASLSVTLDGLAGF